ncbi:GUN4 domain-containing protein [Iningainema sp. BLCCT55]|uniref:GUN4 domain-containing protein n=2 Tax=Iningainema TaxID=1932705 RepID=A0A8J6XLT3_9CYAN|nr:GUN4 domain-containing protein [Iningainema tapete BLCC-T55]
MVISALDYNPRRVKQFINLFRLKAFIAASTGLFDDVQSEDFNKQHLTLEQLGKFTVLVLKWPRLLVDLDADHALMKKLQNYALSVSPNFDDYDSTTKYWGGDAKLVELLRYSDKQETQDSKIMINEKYSLEGIDIAKLLQVSPRITRPKQQSEKGIDYTKLENLLKAGQWFEADYETYLVILQAVGRSTGDWIRVEELLNFPCTDLRTIDSLWVRYSNGRFGFSVQKRIYLEVGGMADGKFYEEAWKKFGDRVGWREKGQWIGSSNVVFNTSAPQGHLPEYVCYEKHIHERWSILSHRCL